VASILKQIGVKVGEELKALGPTNPSDSYSETTFTNGLLSGLTLWATSSKSVKLSSKTFTYTSGNLTSVVEKDGSDVITLTKTLAYDGDGNVSSITKDYA
jgi:YD repeat-containing protein